MKRSKSKIEVIFFDAGGTLLHPAKPVGEIYAEVAHENYGLEWDETLIERGFRRAFKKRVIAGDPEIEATPRDHKAWWKEIVREALIGVVAPSQFPFDSYFEKLYFLFQQPELWRIYPEVFDVLQKLKNSGYRLAILSNWDSRLNYTLAGLKLTPFFDQILISAELGFEKPQPNIYRAALERFGIQAKQALMVGDETVNDFEAPQAQGWEAILIERPQDNLHAVIEWLESTQTVKDFAARPL